MACAIIFLANNQKFNFSKYILDNMVKNLEARVKFYMFPRFVQVFMNHQLGDMSHHKGIFVNLSLIKKVKKLEGKKKKRTHGLKRLYKVILSAKGESSEDEEGLGNQEDASKQERSIADIDQDKGITLVDDTQGRMNDQDMFGVHDLDGDEVVVDISAGEKEEHSEKVAEKEVSTADPVTTASKVVTTADVEVSAALTTTTTTDDELTMAQTLIEIKAAKPKALTTAVSTRPKEKGIIMQEPSETPSPKPIVSSQQPSQLKDKGKAKMVELERPLKRKEQIMMDEQIARDLEAQMQADLEVEQRIAKQKEDEANIAMVAE
nr:hypothetical protein [Tanacetum cinerariifolium]